MAWLLGKEFKFEAAHFLPKHDGKCQRLHGHSWRGVIYVLGDTLVTSGAKAGMLIDYADIKRAIAPLVENYLDHHCLNETTKLDAPTSEQLAQWIFEKLEPTLTGLWGVRIDETCTSTCLYTKSSNPALILSNEFAVG